ncbi:hypothetical protein LDENG_00181250 [Lucifuga dentata]|nr:hypothetical protein LDENG_00181250 [Lucifuga dentata]
MPLKRCTSLLIFLFCSLALWCKSTSGGSSFLSPSQKPQIKGKASRVSRHIMEDSAHPNEDNHITISAPLEIGITMKEEDFEEYGILLQEIMQRLLGNTEKAGLPKSSVL